MVLALALICAGFSTAAAIFHLMFSSLFGWKRALPRLDPTHRAIMIVLNLAIVVIFALLAIYLLAVAAGWLPRDTGTRATLAGIATFMMLRAAMQPVYFGLASKGSALFLVATLAGAAGHAALAFLYGRSITASAARRESRPCSRAGSIRGGYRVLNSRRRCARIFRRSCRPRARRGWPRRCRGRGTCRIRLPRR